MVTVLVVTLIVLVIGTVVMLEAGDVIIAKAARDAPPPDGSLPFLIVPPLSEPAPSPQPVPQPIGQHPGVTDSATIMFRRPSDEPLHVLPGRFEVAAGEAQNEDFRFVGKFGEIPEVIVGRETGAAQSLTLRSPTVSRRHARLQFVDGRWTIANLSKTNPVVLNDERLTGESGVRPLTDGDRIELGDVVIRFHVR